MRQKLEVAANFAIIAFVVIVGGFYLRENLSSQRSSQQIQQIKAGEQLPALNNYHWNSHAATLLIALKNSCSFCEESIPFYKRLLESKRKGLFQAVQIVAIVPDDHNALEYVMREQGAEFVSISSVRLTSFKIFATPTVILVDRNGRVVKSWVGRLRESEEGEVIDSVRAMDSNGISER